MCLSSVCHVIERLNYAKPNGISTHSLWLTQWVSSWLSSHARLCLICLSLMYPKGKILSVYRSKSMLSNDCQPKIRFLNAYAYQLECRVVSAYIAYQSKNLFFDTYQSKSLLFSGYQWKHSGFSTHQSKGLF